ncbi:5'-methylthioadenosine/S-adenosylhomocysteine nucleosidase-like [Montipora foliosa]|uniref:5'-methylthioadenosine/S-adenosylhomocysteine nucleosidase-like n=1 Tax=Montipora foliosa TaxID=591990 RepID=UPI0035F1EF7F
MPDVEVTPPDSTLEAIPGNPPGLDRIQLKPADLPKDPVPWENVELPIDIMLLTAKDCELCSCLQYCLDPGYFRSYCRNVGYVYFGKMGEGETKLKIAVIRCNVGSTVPMGSAVVVPDAVRMLSPKAVFCVGYCGGLNKEKVKLGDVVISAKLASYAPVKVNEDGVTERGVRVPASTGLAKLTIGADYGWRAPLKNPRELEVKVHKDALLLSGPEVVNSEERRDELIQRYPDAIAIEMEGEGLYTAAHRLNVEWVVIKGVSDFAAKKSSTDSWRPFANAMAASVTAHILRDPYVFQDWPHCA